MTTTEVLCWAVPPDWEKRQWFQHPDLRSACNGTPMFKKTSPYKVTCSECRDYLKGKGWDKFDESDGD